jgi:hypothetical protein
MKVTYCLGRNRLSVYVKRNDAVWYRLNESEVDPPSHRLFRSGVNLRKISKALQIMIYGLVIRIVDLSSRSYVQVVKSIVCLQE